MITFVRKLGVAGAPPEQGGRAFRRALLNPLQALRGARKAVTAVVLAQELGVLIRIAPGRLCDQMV